MKRVGTSKFRSLIRALGVPGILVAVLTAPALGLLLSGKLSETLASESSKESDTKADGKKDEGKGSDTKGGERKPGSAPEEFSESKFASPTPSGGPSGGDNAARENLPSSKKVDELRVQKELIEAKQKELAGREAELAAKERAVDEELKKIKEVRENISKTEGDRKQLSEEKVAKVIETLETMSPKSAAAILASLEENLAIAAMVKMATAKLAKVMNLMDPSKASHLTEMMAGVVKARVPSSVRPAGHASLGAGNPTEEGGVARNAASAPRLEKKGGEKIYDANSNNNDRKSGTRGNSPERKEGDGASSSGSGSPRDQGTGSG